MARRRKPTTYWVRASRDELRLDIDENFWNDEVVKADGTTQLDLNIASVIEEIRCALYYVGFEGTRH